MIAQNQQRFHYYEIVVGLSGGRKMSYCWSKYNIEVEKRGRGTVIYNSKSGAICEIENEIIDKYCKNGAEINCEPYFDEMCDMGFVERDDELECDDYVDNVFRIVLSCTEKCNLNCYYCFESQRRETSFFEIDKVNSFLDFTENYLKGHHIDCIHIIWFGGEPVLCYKDICNITPLIKKICHQYKVKYKASLVTNGTMLSAEIVEKLKDSNIGNVQITVDGDEEKFIENKAGTIKQWNNFFENFRNIVEKFDVSLRLNLDNNNFDSIIKLIHKLKGEGLSSVSKISFGRIVCKSETLSYRKFCESKIKIISYLLNEIGIEREKIFHELDPIASSCPMLKKGAVVIDSMTFCHKCEEDIEKKESVSLVLEQNQCVKIVNSDISNIDKRCRTCVIYPICKGECQRHWNMNDCKTKIDYIKDLVKIRIECDD